MLDWSFNAICHVIAEWIPAEESSSLSSPTNYCYKSETVRKIKGKKQANPTHTGRCDTMSFFADRRRSLLNSLLFFLFEKSGYVLLVFMFMLWLAVSYIGGFLQSVFQVVTSYFTRKQFIKTIFPQKLLTLYVYICLISVAKSSAILNLLDC